MIGKYKKLLREIKEFKKYREGYFDATIVNCRANCEFNNSDGLCIKKAIILDRHEGNSVRCIFND